MVWIEIWEQKYDRRYDYMATSLVNRYNEKFDKFVKFLKNHHSLLTKCSLNTRYDSISFEFDGVVRETQFSERILGTTFVATNCTKKQIKTLKEIFGDEINECH